MQKSEMLNELKRMLNDVLTATTKGVSYQRLARAHGYVDGYMKALLDSGSRRWLAVDRATRPRVERRPASGRARREMERSRVWPPRWPGRLRKTSR